MNYDSLQAKTIRYLRLPVGIGVVFVHSYGTHVDMQAVDYLSLSGLDLHNIFRVVFSQIISTVASPFFFLVSGYFYFKDIGAFNKKVYLSKTTNRIKSMLIPYTVWNLLAFMIPILTMVFKGDLFTSIETLKGFKLLDVFWVHKIWDYSISQNLLGMKMYLTGPFNGPLWFLRELFIMSLISPVIFLFVKKTKITGIIVLSIIYLTRSWVSVPGFNITAVFFFTLGSYFSINNKNLIEVLRKVKNPLYIALSIIFIVNLITMGQTVQVLFIHQLFKILGLFSLIVFTSYSVENNRVWLDINNPLVRSSFVIYVAHSVSILGFVQKVFYHIFQPVSPFLLTLRYLSVVFVTVFICMCLYLALKYFTPRFYRVITGSR